MKENIRNTRHVQVYGVRLTVSCLILLVSDSLRSMHEGESCLRYLKIKNAILKTTNYIKEHYVFYPMHDVHKST